MTFETLIFMVITGLLFYNIYKTKQDINKLRKRQDDLNITFRGEHGITLEKKEYPEMEDDFRQETSEPKKKMSDIMKEGYDPKTKTLYVDGKYISGVSHDDV